MGVGFIWVWFNGVNVDVGSSSSVAVLGDYYFNTESNNRPFAGFGIGAFSSGDITIDTGSGTSTAEGGSGLGLIGRVGYELGFLRISGEYNLLTSDGSSNYLGIQLGLTLFGRRK